MSRGRERGEGSPTHASCFTTLRCFAFFSLPAACSPPPHLQAWWVQLPYMLPLCMLHHAVLPAVALLLLLLLPCRNLAPGVPHAGLGFPPEVCTVRPAPQLLDGLPQGLHRLLLAWEWGGRGGAALKGKTQAGMPPEASAVRPTPQLLYSLPRGLHRLLLAWEWGTGSMGGTGSGYGRGLSSKGGT